MSKNFYSLGPARLSTIPIGQSPETSNAADALGRGTNKARASHLSPFAQAGGDSARRPTYLRIDSRIVSLPSYQDRLSP
jgi:hypothetical protein